MIPVRLVCRFCGRGYVLDRLRGHTRSMCNSCSANRSRSEFKQRVVDFLGGKCERCGYNKCLAAMHAHHRDPSEKKFGIGTGHCRNWDRVVEELEKCVLLCANCHAEEHHSENGKIAQALLRVPRESRPRASWPSRSTLTRWAVAYPMTIIGDKVGVSSVAVKKMFKKLGIASRGRGGWGHNAARRSRNIKTTRGRLGRTVSAGDPINL